MCKMSDFELLVLEKHEIACEDFDALLGDYVEGDLPEVLEEKLNLHLESCSECQDGLELYQQVIDIAGVIGRSTEDDPMPSGVKRRLHEKLNQSLGLKLSTAV